MLQMSFRLCFDEPISDASIIFPDSFIIKIYGKDVPNTVEFDFKSYSYSVEGKYVTCLARDLDCEAFPGSNNLMEMLLGRMRGVDWVAANIYIARDAETGKQPKLLTIFDPIIIDDKARIAFPAYFPEEKRGDILNKSQLSLISRVMDDAVGFCTAHLFNDETDRISLYDSNGVVYLRTLAGDGYFLNTETNEIGMFGSMANSSNLERVREVFDCVLDRLTSIPFPVSCIQMPCGKYSSGVWVPSKRESGAYDIIIE